jgi:hypothetical protein
MLIMPPGHSRAIRARRRISTRERWVIWAVVGVLAAVCAGIVLGIVTSSPKSSNGCVHATIAGPLGAEAINQCGAEAKALCSSVSTRGFSAQAIDTIRAECRKAGLS